MQQDLVLDIYESLEEPKRRYITVPYTEELTRQSAKSLANKYFKKKLSELSCIPGYVEGDMLYFDLPSNDDEYNDIGIFEKLRVARERNLVYAVWKTPKEYLQITQSN